MPTSDPNYQKLFKFVKDFQDLNLYDPDLKTRLRLLKIRARAVVEETARRPGNPSINEARKIAVAQRKREAKKRRAYYQAEILNIRMEGAKTLDEVIAGLERKGIRPPKADQWSRPMLSRMESGNHRPIAKAINEIVVYEQALKERLRVLNLHARNVIERATRKPGNPALDEARKIAVAQRKRAANKKRSYYQSEILEIRKEGALTLDEVIAGLERKGINPPKAKKWSRSMLSRMENGSHKSGPSTTTEKLPQPSRRFTRRAR